MRGKIILKKTVQALSVGTLLVVLLAGGLFTLAQTETGRRWTAKLLVWAISTASGMAVEVGRLQGTIPFHIRLDRLSLADPAGPWFTGEDLVIRWSPTALLRGRVHVHEFTADLVRLERLPETGKSAKPSRREPPSWPRVLWRLKVQHLAVARLALGEALLGEQALFTLEAGLTGGAGGEESRFSLALERMEGPALQIAATVALAEAPSRTLLVHVQAREAAGGLLSRFLGARGPLTLAFHGACSRRPWRPGSPRRAGSLWRLTCRETIPLSSTGSLWRPKEFSFTFPARWTVRGSSARADSPSPAPISALSGK
ncbi:MAG: hypothetical protein H6Q51_1688 [Deltaproteobacteria bacterium]|nr:hypothetical protein [Deltaproteobacteria bacterium]